MNAADERARARLLVYLRRRAVAAVTQLENARGQSDANAASNDMREISELIDWAQRVGLDRGSRFGV